jgi:hypothetical protein
MRLRDLIDRLEECCQELGDGAEVRLMTQQSWPFENRICGVTTDREINRAGGDDEDEPADEDDEAGEGVVFIVEGGQLGYGTKKAWGVCGG